MSMPRTPDDIVLDDFYASTLRCRHQVQLGALVPAILAACLVSGALTGDRARITIRCLSGSFLQHRSSPTCALKGKGTARESPSGPIEPKASHPPPATLSLDVPMAVRVLQCPKNHPALIGLRQRGTEETGNKREADDPHLPQWDNHVALLNRSSRWRIPAQPL
jgi:hypothetical protein